jgi:hypothetical protein
MALFSKEEIIAIVIASLVMGYLLAFNQISWLSWISYAGISLLIVLVHHIGYKTSASLLDCSTETQLWTLKQFWFSTKSHFKKPFPVWLFIPLILVWLTFGLVKWIGILTFNVIPLASRVRFRWRELTEWHIALIATGAAIANMGAAVIAKAFGFDSFAAYNMIFVLYSLIPIGQLDGTKIFFGSRMLWIFMLIFSAVMLLLIQTMPVIYTIISAVCIALFAWVMFYFFVEAS